MKKFLLFFTIFLLSGCQSIHKNDKVITKINCPSIFFSSENNSYAQGELDGLNLENVDYKAVFNNFRFLNDCFSDSTKNFYTMDVLIVVEPINPKSQIINLPIFALLYNNKNQVIDRQYFRILDNFNYIEDTSEYQVTDVVGNLNIELEKNENVNFITIGFVNIKN